MYTLAVKTTRMTSRHPVTAILGYGSQGRAIALNLRDSGWPIMVGLKARSKSISRARREGIRDIRPVTDAVTAAQLIVMAVPDHLHRRVFDRDIFPNMRKGATLLFLSGMSIHFGFVRPPADSDVVMLAPHAPGLALREKYLTDKSVSAFYAIHQNASDKGLRTVTDFATGIGIAKNRMVKSRFEWEAIGDIFGEQAVLCGGLAGLIQAGFDTLVRNGIPAEHAYLEVAYQLDLIVDLVKRFGIEGMFRRISVAARYGSLVSGSKIVDAHVRAQMQKVLLEVKSGKFPRNLDKLSESQIAEMDKKIHTLSRPAFEKAARKYARKS